MSCTPIQVRCSTKCYTGFVRERRPTISDTARARNIRRVRNRIIILNEDLAEAVADARQHERATGTVSFAAHATQLALHTQLAEAHRELASFAETAAAA